MPYKKRKVGGYPTKRGVSSAQRRALTKARKTRKDNRLARQRQARRTPSSPSPPQQSPPRSPSPPSGQSPPQSPPRSMSPPSGQSPPPSGRSPPQSPPSGQGLGPRLFCGNNSNFSGLTNGTHVVGTRKKCLRRGRKIGYAMPADPDYAGAYQPITARQLHCEDTNVVPPNHTLGTLHWCLSKGIGFGKAKKARDTFGP